MDPYLYEHALDKPFCGQIDSWPGEFLTGDNVIQPRRLLEATLNGDTGLPLLTCEEIWGSRLQALHPYDCPAFETFCLKFNRPAKPKSLFLTKPRAC